MLRASAATSGHTGACWTVFVTCFFLNRYSRFPFPPAICLHKSEQKRSHGWLRLT